jgi:hypothetical protein
MLVQGSEFWLIDRAASACYRQKREAGLPVAYFLPEFWIRNKIKE